MQSTYDAREIPPRAKPLANRDEAPVLGRALPVVGHIPWIVRDLPSLLEAGSRLGPLFWVHFGPTGWQLFTSREEGFGIFRNRETSSLNIGLNTGELFGKSLLVIDGDQHRRSRSLLNPTFTPRGLTQHEAGAQMAEVIVPRVRSWVGRPTIRVADETRDMAIDVIFRLIGTRVDDLPRWRVYFEEVVLLLAPLRVDLPGMPLRKGRRARAWLEKQLALLVEQARASGDDKTLLGSMVHARDEEGRSMDDAELLDNLLVLGLAGHETTASTLAWALLHLAREPHWWWLLVDEALASPGLPTTPKDLERHPLAEGIFREALRLHPPVTLDARMCMSPFDLMGYTVRRGTIVGCSLYGLARNAARYPDPHRFDPSRWTRLGRKPDPLETSQFGGGPHFCLGYHVALLEGVQFLVSAAREFGERRERPFFDAPEMPRAPFMPLLRPPRSTELRFARR